MTLLRILSLLVLGWVFMGASCQERPDAYIGVFITKEPLIDSYTYSTNSKTEAHKATPISGMDKWICTSPDDFEIYRDFYKNQCAQKVQEAVSEANRSCAR